MTAPVTWEFLALLVAIVCTPLGLIAGLWWRVEQRREGQLSALTEAFKKDLEGQNRAIQAAHAAAVLVGSQLAEFRVHAAERFVSKDSVQRMHDEVMSRLARIETRLDRAIERSPPAL